MHTCLNFNPPFLVLVCVCRFYSLYTLYTPHMYSLWYILSGSSSAAEPQEPLETVLQFREHGRQSLRFSQAHNLLFTHKPCRAAAPDMFASASNRVHDELHGLLAVPRARRLVVAAAAGRRLSSHIHRQRFKRRKSDLARRACDVDENVGQGRRGGGEETLNAHLGRLTRRVANGVGAHPSGEMVWQIRDEKAIIVGEPTRSFFERRENVKAWAVISFSWPQSQTFFSFFFTLGDTRNVT